MDTPYEEKLAKLRAFFVDKGDYKYADELAQEAAEAIGLREMMEARDLNIVGMPEEPPIEAFAMALHDIDDIRGNMREGKQVFREFYRAMRSALTHRNPDP